MAASIQPHTRGSMEKLLAAKAARTPKPTWWIDPDPLRGGTK